MSVCVYFNFFLLQRVSLTDCCCAEQGSHTVSRMTTVKVCKINRSCCSDDDDHDNDDDAEVRKKV